MNYGRWGATVTAAAFIAACGAFGTSSDEIEPKEEPPPPLTAGRSSAKA